MPAMMQDPVSYVLTVKGQKELRDNATTLSPTQIELLVRIDGALTFAQLSSSMPAVSSVMFTATFQQLLDQRLVAVAEADPFAAQFRIPANKLVLSGAQAEADAGALSLKRSGFYVGIARKRGLARPLAPGEVRTAIVVEDEPMLAKFIQSYLSFEGFQVRLAGNRAEVIAEFRKSPVPDLILLDVMLPDTDGFDILLRLRQHPALQNVPVIMLTGKATREAVIKGLAGGADGYITKPFEADALMRAVRTVIGLTQEQALPHTAGDPWSNRDAKA